MNKEEEIKKLVEEMTPNVILYIETLMEHYEKLEEENKQLKLELLEKRCSDKDVEYQEKLKLQKRIDKAIEYIEYNDDSLYTFEPDYDYEENLIDNYEVSNYREDLLKILKGDSNE